MTFTPEDRMIIVFPSWMTHYVMPFREESIRISMSGNFYISEKVPLCQKMGVSFELLQDPNVAKTEVLKEEFFEIMNENRNYVPQMPGKS